MSWIPGVAADTPLESVLGHRSELLEGYRAFYRSLWRDGLAPRRVLELARLRIAAIHDCQAEWLVRDAAAGVSDDDLAALRAGDVEHFAEPEQAALAVAECMPYAHHQISDADVDALVSAFAPAGAVALLTALAFFDASCRAETGTRHRAAGTRAR